MADLPHHRDQQWMVSTGRSKTGHTHVHLESQFHPGMTWENYGEWHVDHIRPVSSFSTDTPMSVVNALTNLQPLWRTSRWVDGVFYQGNLNKGTQWAAP